jgi:hypothetical protein
MPYKDPIKQEEYFKSYRKKNRIRITLKNRIERNNDERTRNLSRLRTKRWNSKNLEKRAIIQQRYSKNHPEKIKAQQQASYKIDLKEKCEICCSKDKLERHHWRYDKPLLVNTLCNFCHNVQHKSIIGGNYNRI